MTWLFIRIHEWWPSDKIEEADWHNTRSFHLLANEGVASSHHRCLAGPARLARDDNGALEEKDLDPSFSAGNDGARCRRRCNERIFLSSWNKTSSPLVPISHPFLFFSFFLSSSCSNFLKLIYEIHFEKTNLIEEKEKNRCAVSRHFISTISCKNGGERNYAK